MIEIAPEHLCQTRCAACPFAGPKVGSKGDPTSPVVFVAESPGQHEVRSKVPLTGPSGKVFHTYVPEDKYYILNALECCPPTKLKDEARMTAAIFACKERLLEKIKAHPRRIIIAMGNPAVRSLVGDLSLKITQIRGRLIPSPLSELGIFPIVHTAALMRGTGSLRQWKEDIAYALEMGAGAPQRVHNKGEAELVTVGNTTQGNAWYVDNAMLGILAGSPKTPKMTCDIETTGLNPYALPNFIVRKSNKLVDDPQEPARILSIGITPEHDPSISYCFFPEHLPGLKRWLENTSIVWNWHNGKFDIKFLRAVGINARVDDDTMLLSYTLDETGGIHDLETVAGDVLDAPNYKHMLNPYVPASHPMRSYYEEVPKEVLAEYQAGDTCNTEQIRKIYRARVANDPALEKLYTRTLIPASKLLADVEEVGIKVDLDRLEENDIYFGAQLMEVKEKIWEVAGIGSTFNPGSPQQVSRLLFNIMRFPDKAKGSTNKDVLTKLQEKTEHPIFGLLLKYRTAVKMRGTYVIGILKWVDANGRIHSTFLLHGTRTGRLASREPNMQNPPRDPQIRGTFVAEEGYELIECDLKQAELRSLAALSGDPTLVQIFLEGGNPHSELAPQIFPGWKGKNDPIGYEQYVRCKNVNFGVIYGITKMGLSEQINDTPTVAQALLDGWYETFPIAGKYIAKCRATVNNNQIMTTVFGRKKRVGIVARSNIHFLQNEAANFPHQSIASDITLHAAIRCAPRLVQWGVRIVNLIHDSILMEVPLKVGLREQVIRYVCGTMEQVPIDWGITRVPFEAEGEYGQRWGQGNMKELKLEAA